MLPPAPVPTPSVRRLSAGSVLGVALVAAAFAPWFSACILDFSNLSDGEAQCDGCGDASGDLAATLDAIDATSADAGDDAPDSGCPVLECGACVCPGGECEPVVLASGTGVAASPRGIAVTADSLLWVNHASGTLMRLAGSGGPPAVLTSAVEPLALVADTVRAIWSERDGVWTCTLADCETTKHRLAKSLADNSVLALAYDGQRVYWTDLATGQADGQVLSCAADACVAPDTEAIEDYRPYGIALYGDTVFWTMQGDGSDWGTVYKSSKGAFNETTVASGLVMPTSLVVDDSNVYWTQWTGAGKVLRCAYGAGPCQGAAIEDVAPAGGALGRPFDIGLGGGRLYWSNMDDGTVTSCPLPGCGAEPPVVHASGRTGVQRIALNSSCVFWTDDTGGGSVGKAAR